MLLFFKLLGLFFFVSLAYAASRGAPWVPTRKRDIARLLSLLNLKDGQKMYELGCGDGRVSIAVAKKTGAYVVGVELSFLHVVIANILAWMRGVKNMRFVWGDIYKQDFFDADAVYLFLMPRVNEKLRPKLERELKPGALVVSYVWPIAGWTPNVVDEALLQPKMYVYEMPPRHCEEFYDSRRRSAVGGGSQ